MRLAYDPETDSLYIDLSEKASIDSLEVSPGVVLDFDAEGNLVGMDCCIVIEKHPDGYVAYPLEIEGVVVGQGDTYEGALSDVSPRSSFTLRPLGLNCQKHTSREWDRPEIGD